MAKNRYNLVLMSIDRPSDSGESEAHGQHWEPIADELLPEVKKRGMLLSMSEHSMPYYFPRSLFKDHPEWFSLLRGKRHPGQMCYSNKEAVEYYAKAQAAFAAKHPEIDMLGTWPLDGGGYCECEGCKDLETVFKAVVKVAEEVEKVQPGMIVEHLAYKPQTFKVPETVEIPTNVSVLVCNRTDQLARDWVEAMQGKGGAYYFEYRLADHYNWVANVWLQPQYALEITKICSDIGYRSIASLYLPVQVWWRASLNYYFMGKAMWDIEMDVQEELDKYCRAYYADQADKVRQVFDILLEKIQNRVLEGTHFFPDGRKNKLPVARWAYDGMTEPSAEALKLLEEAAADTKDARAKRHIYKLKVYIEYMLLYYDYRSASAQNREKTWNALIEYVSNLPPQADGVCPEPKYIEWRLAQMARQEGRSLF